VVQIIARKSGITVSCGANTSTIKEGQQLSGEDAANCGLVDKTGGASPAAKGPILDSTWARDAGRLRRTCAYDNRGSSRELRNILAKRISQ